MSIEQIKDGMMKGGQITTKISAEKETKGKRYRLPLDGREIEVVYYEASNPKAPLICCMHGGGFLFGGCAFDDDMWDYLRNDLNVNVVSIGYRKTPDHRYPDALKDVYESIIYMKECMPELEFDRNHISTLGNSAGATLAAAVCLYAKEMGGVNFKYQILNYPFLDVYTDPEEKEPGLTEEEYASDRFFNELYIDHEKAKDKFVSPSFASVDELKGLPEAIIMVSEHDSLRAEGEKYARDLEEAGVTTHLFLARDMQHIFFERAFTKQNPKEPYWYDLQESGLLWKRAEETIGHIKCHFFG